MNFWIPEHLVATLGKTVDKGKELEAVDIIIKSKGWVYLIMYLSSEKKIEIV